MIEFIMPLLYAVLFEPYNKFDQLLNFLYSQVKQSLYPFKSLFKYAVLMHFFTHIQNIIVVQGKKTNDLLKVHFFHSI